MLSSKNVSLHQWTHLSSSANLRSHSLGSFCRSNGFRIDKAVLVSPPFPATPLANDVPAKPVPHWPAFDNQQQQSVQLNGRTTSGDNTTVRPVVEVVSGTYSQGACRFWAGVLANSTDVLSDLLGFACG